MSIRDMVPWRWGGLRHWEGSNERTARSFDSQIEALHREMDRLFEDLWVGGGDRSLFAGPMRSMEFLPRVDETEDEKAYYVNIDLPGMDEKDVDISVTDRVLTIRGEKKEEEEDKGKDVYRRERSYGSFRRMLQLPGEVDQSKIEASFSKGVLRISLPKTAEAREKVRHIPVKAA
jgi:HSP20 family protein